MADVLETRLHQAQAEPWRRLTSSRHWSRTSSRAAPAVARAPPQAGRFPRRSQNARQFRFRLQPEDESQRRLRPRHRAFIERREDALFLGPAARAKATWHRPSARPLSSRATKCSTAKLTSCSNNSLTLRSTVPASSTWNRSPPSPCSSSMTSACASFPDRRRGSARNHHAPLRTRQYPAHFQSPVEDWGKLLADVAAVSAMLDACSTTPRAQMRPRSWRTKTATATEETGPQGRSFSECEGAASRSRI